ncbi:MAG: adenylate/guanylate cyclase domain-containing protein [Chloroflexota bacterium]|nr:adenylate/guanylate cyclase domain-containing protein [Chloroflexota bacterium]
MTALSSAIEQLQQLRQDTREALDALERQQSILRLRGGDFQAGLLELAQTLPTEFEAAALRIRDSEQELMQLRALAETTALINSSFDPDQVLESAMDAVVRLTGAGRAYLLLQDALGQLNVRLARRRDDEMYGDEGVSRTVLQQVIASGEALLTDNATEDARVSGSDTVGRYGLRSILCVPLHIKGQVGGAIYVDNRFRSGVFTQRELHLLNAFANQIAIALENARLFASVQTSLREIAQASELMRNVFSSIASGVITTDSRDMISAYNAAAANILQVPPEQAFEQPLRAVLPLMGGSFEDALAAAQIDNQSVALEAEPDIPNRGRIALQLKISPLKTADGATEGVAMVLDDLTAERERTQTLDLLRRYLPPGMVENIQHIAQLGLGGERREVTCLFIDVGDLETMTVVRPAQKMDLLNVRLDAVTTLVHQAGGVIDKYIGNDVMALFNTQLNPQPAHARLAVETALLLRDQFVAAGGQAHYRIGIHTGIATLGNVGGIQRQSFTALGDSINLAKRLQENAFSAQIIVSEATLDSIAAHGGIADLRFHELAPIMVKGRHQATQVYEVFRA